jgi:hypothetical protein
MGENSEYGGGGDDEDDDSNKHNKFMEDYKQFLLLSFNN